MRRTLLLLSLALLGLASSAYAGTGYGSLNNFDAVNDTGVPCHGFEIEIEGVHSKDITYTYNWNHYGPPRIFEDNSDPLHPRCFIRYESGKNPDGSWKAYTAVPAGPIAATDGHQFTNPGVNFGGEHFGVGYYGAPSTVKYSWLIDDGAGNLVFGSAVNIGTPVFTYYPPVINVAPAQVQAVIEAPEPPEVPILEFGEASWVKVITTQTHNSNKVELDDLVADDPDDDNDVNWRNGEPDEVEVEWQLLQTEFNQPDGGANGEQVGVPEDLENGDEVITRRYEFFKYVGPLDDESGEAKASNVGEDDLHGEGIKLINGEEVDLGTVIVVGDYIGAQMAAFDAVDELGLIGGLQDGEVNQPYVERTLVVGGTAPVITTLTGALPDGMDFEVVEGLLSGTPLESGEFLFTLHSTDAAGADVSKDYSLFIAEAPITESYIATLAVPVEGGSTSGDGTYENGLQATVEALAEPGFEFVNWTEGGIEVSASASYTFSVAVDRTLSANFIALHAIATSAAPAEGGTTAGDGDYPEGAEVIVEAAAEAGYEFLNWTEGSLEVSTDAIYSFTATGSRSLQANFLLIPVPVYRNVGDLVTLSETGRSSTLNRVTRKLTSVSTVTIANHSASSIVAPLNLLVTGLAAGITMPEASGAIPGGYTYDLQSKLGLASLAPGQSASIQIKFVYPTTARLSYALQAWGTAE
ncbi:MAG: hypothetical protein HYV27_20425 [Candidatus Hydrogenedentes bacterium]|nr:hypothetical protein [Candidatus Hydrogenedentota bacterium]